MKKKVSLWVVLLITWLFLGMMVLFGWSVWHILNGGHRLGSFSKTIINIASFPQLVRESFQTFKTSSFVVIDDKYPNIKSIRERNNLSDDGYILLSSFDHRYKQSAVNLIRLKDSKFLHTWVLNLDELKQWHISLNGIDKGSFRMIHPLLLEDGSIIFQNMGGPLIRLSAHSKIKWILEGKFSHSIELDAGQNIWVPNIIDSAFAKPYFIKSFNDDAITKISQEGKLLFQKSIAEILIKNGYRGLLLGVGPVTNDHIHLNDIQPALTSTRYWKKGDLLISLRHRSTVFLYRPSTNKILWLKTGPWLNQHDCDFIDSTKIGVFGNNIIRSFNSLTIEQDLLIDGHNEEYIYDFSTNKVSTPYTEFFSKSKIGTLSEGRSDVLENGDIFVEETNYGRLLRGNKKQEIWSLVDRIDDKHISMLGWSRYISKKEFDKKYSKINFNSK